MNTRMTGDEYMTVLQQRADEWVATQTKPSLRFPPLLTWFIRDGDENLVALPEPERKPKPKPEPRYYRPASYWRAKISRLEAGMESAAQTPINDRAAAGGQALGPKRTARIQAQQDNKLPKYVALRKELEHAQHMLRSAETREKKAA